MASAPASPGASRPSLAPPPDEVVIVAAVPGEPPDADTRLRVILDPDDPTKSIAVMPAAPADPPSE